MSIPLKFLKEGITEILSIDSLNENILDDFTPPSIYIFRKNWELWADTLNESKRISFNKVMDAYLSIKEDETDGLHRTIFVVPIT